MSQPVISSRVLADYAALATCWVGDPAGLHFRFFPGGHLHSVGHGPQLLINLTIGCPLAGAMHRVEVELATGADRRAVMLIGPGSRAVFSTSGRQARWHLRESDCELTALLAVDPATCRWRLEVSLTNLSPQPLVWRIFHGLDVGLTSPFGARNNETYTSQYIDHRPLVHPVFGTVLASRQNLPVDGRNPLLLQACTRGCAGFATDARDAFGGAVHRPHSARCLAPEPTPLPGLRQAESSYVALLSQPIDTAAGSTESCAVVAVFQSDHPEPTSDADLALLDRPLEIPAATEPFSEPACATTLFHTPRIRHGRDLTETELQAIVTDPWDLIERGPQGELWSWFAGPESRHFVTRAKEAASARPHANILRSGGGDFPAASQLTTTTFMAGVFNALLSSGHPSFHRLLAFPRESCGLISSGGQRIWFHDGEGWCLLGVPSYFEMALDQTRWCYALPDRDITVTVTIDPQRSLVRTEIRVTAGPATRLRVTHGLIAGAAEYDATAELEINADAALITVRAAADGLFRKEDPDARFTVRATEPSRIATTGGAEHLPGGSPAMAMAVFETHAVDLITLEIEGHTGLADPPTTPHTWQDDALALRLRTAEPTVRRIQRTLPWFAHNAIIHLTVPHGIEQYNGGAWGTRDVTQGSVELLLALGRFATCRQVLLHTYRHQFAGLHHWPQWFMTAPFGWIQTAHCHGDIPLWPLKALCDYLEATSDFAVLDEPVAWTDPATSRPTADSSPLLDHVTANLRWLRDHCIPGTALVRYGDGDWNDSLQPARPEFRDRLVSSWSVALCYQVLRRLETLGAQCGREIPGLAGFADAAAADFRRFLIIDGTLCGFFLFDDGPANGGQPLLHPQDRLTGIHYRLLPMTRSMLGGLFTAEEAAHHLGLIRRHLLAADGARLMDRPPAYRGGLCEVFQRAELSSCFSREIGLFYVHAHLRYIEAMARLGEAEAMLDGFGRVTPPALGASVPHALPRQANAYFSSSDAAVTSRYEAAERYAEITAGKIGVDGGWRIYSSGPGIYLGLVISRMLGIRTSYGHLVVDPVLPHSLDGLEAEIPWENHRLTLRFTVAEGNHTPRSITLNGTTLLPARISPNPYRSGGWEIPLDNFRSLLGRENLLEIRL